MVAGFLGGDETILRRRCCVNVVQNHYDVHWNDAEWSVWPGREF